MQSITKISQGIVQAYDDENKKRVVADISGLSTDEKPLGYANGSTFLEMDTGKVFVFDQEGDAWLDL